MPDRATRSAPPLRLTRTDPDPRLRRADGRLLTAGMAVARAAPTLHTAEGRRRAGRRRFLADGRAGPGAGHRPLPPLPAMRAWGAKGAGSSPTGSRSTP